MQTVNLIEKNKSEELSLFVVLFLKINAFRLPNLV